MNLGFSILFLIFSFFFSLFITLFLPFLSSLCPFWSYSSVMGYCLLLSHWQLLQLVTFTAVSFQSCCCFHSRRTSSSTWLSFFESSSGFKYFFMVCLKSFCLSINIFMFQKYAYWNKCRNKQIQKYAFRNMFTRRTWSIINIITQPKILKEFYKMNCNMSSKIHFLICI